jgi:hypothetical protein
VGVTVNVKKEAADAYLTRQLYTKLASPSPTGRSARSLLYSQSLLSDATWNETHFKDRPTTLINDAIGATDEASALDLWHQVRQRQYDEGVHRLERTSRSSTLRRTMCGDHAERLVQPRGWNYRDVWLDVWPGRGHVDGGHDSPAALAGEVALRDAGP